VSNAVVWSIRPSRTAPSASRGWSDTEVEDIGVLEQRQWHETRASGVRQDRASVEEIFRAEFDGAWDENGLFLLTMHPHISGHRSRLPVLARLITA